MSNSLFPGVGSLLQSNCGRFSPADATTYYFGGLSLTAPATSAQPVNRMYSPVAGYITAIELLFLTSGGVSGSGQTSTIYLRVNDTTDYTVSTNVSCASLPQTLLIQNLQIPIDRGDFVEWKWTTPTWSPTNPTNVIVVSFITLE